MKRIAGSLGLLVVAAILAGCAGTRDAELEAARQAHLAYLNADADGDGIRNRDDICEGTVPGSLVDVVGCPRDSDGDGVPDYEDECPGTPPGAAACGYGCAIEEVVVFDLVEDEFESGSAVLRPAMRRAIRDFAEGLVRIRRPIELLIVGHTDNVGAEADNQTLSEARAAAAAEYLASIMPNSVIFSFSTSGMGESEPIADNDTDAGRASNRRIEIRILREERP